MRALRLGLVLGILGAVLVVGTASPAASLARTLGLGGARTASAAAPDPVLQWNQIMVSTVAPVHPVFQTRSGAMMHLAQFEAVNSILGGYEPYLGGLTAPAGASADAAAIAAAHRVLVSLFPAGAATLDAARATQLAAIPDGQAKTDGIQVGEAAAQAILADRANDGSATANIPYTPGTDPGEWRPTPPNFPAAFQPGWGQVRPFGIRVGSQFRSPPPPLLGSAKYAQDLNDVQTRGDVNSTVRTQDETDKSRFYAAHAHLFSQAARQVSLAQGKTLSENAQIFALLLMAQADGLISSQETKFYYNYWRPVTAIREADTDGNPKTAADSDWLPLLVTPPYPSYPSAYASAANANRVVVEEAYGKSGHTITLVRENPAAPDLTLHYSAFSQMTDDVNDARVNGGLHFRFDQDAASKMGEHVGQWVVQHYLRPLHG